MPPKETSKTLARHNSIQSALEFIQENASKMNTDNEPLSHREIARKFGVAETTLRRAIANGTVPKRSGPETVLTEYEERELAGYALNMQQLGFGLTKPAINTKIMEIIHRKNRQHPFNGQPGRKWWNRFMKNNPQLSFRVPQALTEARAQRANPIIVRDHFQKLNEIFKQHSLTADRIWNMDETGFNIESRLEKVLAKKGSRQVHKISSGNDHSHISVCSTISAAGTYIPPLIIYKGKMVSEGILEGAPAGTVCAFTDTGYMQESIFRQYIEHFIKSVPSARPLLLMLDGCGSHIDLISIESCVKNNVLLYALPPNTTHILQPSEIPFKKLKSEYSKASDIYHNNGNGELVTKFTFARVLNQAFLSTYTPLAITNAFKATGVWPLNPDAISKERMAPSLTTEIPAKTPPSVHKSPRHITRAEEITGLKRKIEQLEEENKRLKNPGTSSLAQILKYPLQPKSDETTNQKTKRRKAIPFARLLTDNEIRQELQAKANAIQQKAQEIQQRKDERERKKIAREAEKQKKKQQKLKQPKKTKNN